MIERGDYLSEEALALCIDYKRYVVENDEHESGLRKLLNLGHTFGHAIEKLSDYKIPHGLAVAMGIEIIARAGNNASTDKIIKILERDGLRAKHNFTNEQLIEVALSDKKVESEFITLITIKDIGNCVLTKKRITDLAGYLK
jgi:3-dehydroquinate synthase